MNRRALRELYHSTPVPEEELSRRVEEAIRRTRSRLAPVRKKRMALVPWAVLRPM